MGVLESSICLAAAIILVGFVFLSNAIRLVPEYQRLVVFRLGRVLPQSKGPGIVLLMPMIDRAVKVDLREQMREVRSQIAVTKDNVQIQVNFVWYFKIVDPVESVVKVGNLEQTATDVSLSVLRSVIESMTLDEVLSRHENINSTMCTKLDEAVQTWGVKVSNFQIREFVPPPEIVEALNRHKEREFYERQNRRQDVSSILGLSGEAKTSVFTTGTVVINNQTWDATSSRPISPKSKVRVKRVVLEVEEVTST